MTKLNLLPDQIRNNKVSRRRYPWFWPISHLFAKAERGYICRVERMLNKMSDRKLLAVLAVAEALVRARKTFAANESLDEEQFVAAVAIECAEREKSRQN